MVCADRIAALVRALVQTMKDRAVRHSHMGPRCESLFVPVGPGPLDDVLLVLRWSFCHRCRMDDGRSVVDVCQDCPPAVLEYEALDVVQMAWAPMNCSPEFTLAQKPHGIGDVLWAPLKHAAAAEGRALYLECIHDDGSGKLLAHLRALGFVPSAFDPSSMIFVGSAQPCAQEQGP